MALVRDPTYISLIFRIPPAARRTEVCHLVEVIMEVYSHPHTPRTLPTKPMVEEEVVEVKVGRPWRYYSSSSGG